MKEWVTIFVFAFYGSLVAAQMVTLEPQVSSLQHFSPYALDLAKCVFLMGGRSDPHGYWVFGWLLLWVPFFSVSLWLLNRTQSYASVTYFVCLKTALLLALVIFGLGLAMRSPDGPFDPSDPNPIGPAMTVEQIGIFAFASCFIPIFASAFLSNTLIKAGMRLGWKP